MKGRKVKKGIWILDLPKKREGGRRERMREEGEDRTLDGLDCNGGVTGGGRVQVQPPVQWVQG